MSDSVPTVRVLPWAPSQGAFVVINEADFDPSVHTLFVDATEAPAESSEAEPAPAKRKRGR